MIDLLSSSWMDIAAIDPARRVLLMVLGPTEQHGPHLPFGTDIYAAEEMARRLIPLIEKEYNQVVIQAPPLYFAPAFLSRDYPGSVSIRNHHFRSFLIDILASYAQNGLDQAILVSSHIDPPFVRATQSACRTVNETYHARYISGYERFPMEDVVLGHAAEVLGDSDHDGDVHAGLMETGNTLYIRPDLVKKEVFTNLPPSPLPFQYMAQLRSLREAGPGLGYIGFPAEATADHGERWFARYGTRFSAIVRRYLAGEDVFTELTIDHLLPVSPDEKHPPSP